MPQWQSTLRAMSKEFPRRHLIEGYRFVHLDVDLYQPTRDSFDYFYPRLIKGGIIVCDDYNWPGARKAIEEACARFGATFAVTPYLQAVLIRE